MIRIRTIAAALAIIAVPGAALAAPHSDDGRDRNIRFVNNSDYDVYRIYYGRVGQELYGRDLLGDQAINSGGGATRRVDDGTGECWFRIRAESRTGYTFWNKVINVCAESSLTFSG